MQYLPEEIDQYSANHTAAQSELLNLIEQETWQEVLMPRMLSGHQQGRLLSLLSHLIKPDRILEVGTYTGYSAICMAEGLSNRGVLHTIDINDELKPRVEKYLQKGDLSNTIKLHFGDAKHIIPMLKEKWDMVFIDADKESYSDYFDLVIDNMKIGGIIIADNVLWSGKVVDPNENDHETMGLNNFNKKIVNDKRVDHQLLPVRDGLMIARRV